MTSSSMLLPLVLLLASSSAWGMAHAYGGGGLNHICLYMYETTAGANATLLATVLPQPNTTFGMIGLLDDVLLDGPYPASSKVLGRFQGLLAFAGQVTPPGMQSLVSFVFTAGSRFSGSNLVVAGTVTSFDGSFERAIVGGTGVFRMARGWCIVKAVWNPTAVSTVYEVNLFVKTEANYQMPALRMDA